jgi:serine/threonine protein kinase
MEQSSDTVTVLFPSSGVAPAITAANSNLGSSSQPEQSATSAAERFVVFKEMIGRGGYGVVYKGYDTLTGMHVAVKEATVTKQAQHDVQQAMKNEYSLLSTFDHPNIVRVLDYRVSPDQGVAQFVMEWMPGGSVLDVLQAMQFRLHESIVRRYSKDVLRGLVYLHSKKCIHRDVKPGNMLLASDGSIKISDFGISRQKLADSTSSTMGTFEGSPRYMAPESVKSGKFSAASDMWSWGCSVLHMLSNAVPWSERIPLAPGDFIPVVFCIGSGQPPGHHPAIPSQTSPMLKALLESVFSFDPAQRPTAESLLLQHPYFATAEPPQDAGLETYAEYQQLSKQAKERMFGATREVALEIEDSFANGTGLSTTFYEPTSTSTGFQPTSSGSQQGGAEGGSRESIGGNTTSENTDGAGSVGAPSTIASKSKGGKAVVQKPIVTPRSIWAYRMDNGRWVQFNLNDSKILSQAFIEQNGRGSFTLHVQRHNDKRTVPYEIQFDQMQQRNQRTNFCRPIRVLGEGVLAFK